MKTDSVVVLNVSFLNHVHVVSKYLLNCFPYHLDLLVSFFLYLLILAMLLLSAVICPSLTFLVFLSMSWYVAYRKSPMVAIPLPYFLDICWFYTSSFRCESSLIVVNIFCLLVSWFEFISSLFSEWSSAFLHELLPRCLFLWWDFCCRAWIRDVYSFDVPFFYSLFHIFWWSLFLIFTSTCN